jgi:tetratricopeptide (TPR) repeat protein
MSDPHSSLGQRHRLAQEALQSGRPREAHEHCLEILKQDPTFADAWFLCAVIAAQNGQVHKSVEILERALALAPDNAEYHAETGRQYIALHHPDRALAHANIAFEQQPTEIPVLNTLGTVFTQAGEHPRALACYERAVALLEERGATVSLTSQWRAQLYFNLATARQFAGQFDDAEAAYELAIALDDTLFKAISGRSSVRRQTAQSNHLDALEALRDSVTSPRDQLHLGHALAKEYEDLEQFDAAFNALAWGKERQAQASGYRFADDKTLFDALHTLFPDADASGTAGHPSSEPVFIVGMPRTGTTLLEQILASHSRVFAAGELQHFPLQVKRLTGTPSQDVLDLDTLRASIELEPHALGEAYLQSTRPRTGHTPHFIDKLPLNFMYLGLIARALPNARLICLRRDPMDTCLSNFRQLFALDFKHYHYNYDLLTCGQYFVEFDRLMRHWQTIMPQRVHEVSYEALVTDPESTARELLAFCNLEWEAACLDFHRRESAIATPSAVQVRQGIYRSSVARWKRYGLHLDALYALLRDAGFYPED